jgi:hypothetical protein
MAITKAKLSGSTNGKGIVVAGTATASADVIHAAHATYLDEIWLYAVNISATAVKLTVEWGDADEADNIELAIPGESGLVLVIPGLILTGSEDVQAFAATTNVVVIHGYINQIS